MFGIIKIKQTILMNSKNLAQVIKESSDKYLGLAE